MIRAMAACDGRGVCACAADEGLLQTEDTRSTGERGDKAMIDDGSMGGGMRYRERAGAVSVICKSLGRTMRQAILIMIGEDDVS